MDMGDNGVFYGFDPLAVFGDVREDAHGAKDGAGGGGGIGDAFEDAFRDASKIAAAACEQAGGFRVSIESGAAGQLIIVDDVVRIGPANEFGLDFV